MPSAKKFYVDIAKTEGSVTRVQRTIGPYPSMSIAERAERGVNINLNHDEYHTVIRSES